MALKAPNTVCKNRNCTKGKDGGRKVFYSCKYCVHTVSKYSIACCDECYEEYLAQVVDARSKKEQIDMLPERIDMSKSEVRSLVAEADTVEVIRETEFELAEELTKAPNKGYALIVEQINEELDAETEADEDEYEEEGA